MRFLMSPADNGGIYATFETSTGRRKTTLFTNPPCDINHVHKGYLQERFPNVTRDMQVDFIKHRYKEEYERINKTKGERTDHDRIQMQGM